MRPEQPPEESDSGLDRLLRDARWPEPTTEQLTRLRVGWKSLRVQRGPRRYVSRALLAAAASLLLATGVLAWRTTHTRDEPAAPQQDLARNDSASLGDAALSQSALVDPQNRDADAASHDRWQASEPTLYERVVMIGVTRSQHKQTAIPRRKQRRTQLPESVESQRIALNIFALLPESPAAAARYLASLFDDISSWRQRFWTAFPRRSVQLVTHAVESTGRQVRGDMRGIDPHAAAVEVVAREGHPVDIANLIASESDAVSRRQLLAALAERGTAEAVEAYLYFVARPESRVEALDALAAAANVPDGLLLAYLRAPQVSVRHAAALALARSRNPAVVDALAAALADASSRPQAIVALLLSSDPRAATVVNEARGNLYLVASVRAAESELHYLAQTP